MLDLTDFIHEWVEGRFGEMWYGSTEIQANRLGQVYVEVNGHTLLVAKKIFLEDEYIPLAIYRPYGSYEIPPSTRVVIRGFRLACQGMCLNLASGMKQHHVKIEDTWWTLAKSGGVYWAFQYIKGEGFYVYKNVESPLFTFRTMLRRKSCWDFIPEGR